MRELDPSTSLRHMQPDNEFRVGQVLPSVRTGDLGLVLGAGLVVLINTILSHWLAWRGFGWAFALGQFVVLAAVNAVLLLAYALLLSTAGAPVSVANILFFVLLLSLLVTLYDRYRQVYLMRFSSSG